MSKYPPNANILRAVAAGQVGWETAMSEWIDNAFDRKATRVAITFDKDTVTIQDDGEGSPSPHKIVQLGEHTPAPNGLGEFGMGGTESLLWAGGERSSVSILSTHHGVTRRLEMNWLDFARSEWELPDVIERPAMAGEIGTSIQVRPLRARAPKPGELIQKCEGLGYLYSHAIRRDHKQITIKAAGKSERPQVVTAWDPPEFDPSLPIVDSEILVGAKNVRVFAGVVKEGVRNIRSGLTYWYNYRVILKASAKGCGDFTIGRVCGFVELKEGWKALLTRNKNGLTVGDEALFEEVERVILPVLQAAERVGSTFALRSLSARLESHFGSMLGAGSKDKKAKRDKGEIHGSVKPRNTEQKHQRAKQEQPGVRFPGTRSGGGFKVGYEHLGGTKLGEAKPPNVLLNLDNEFIAEAVRTSNEGILVCAIGALIADWDCTQPDDKGNRYLRSLEPTSLPEKLGAILAASPLLDGKAILQAVS